MKKLLIPLLVLVLLCGSLAALAEGSNAVTLELNTAKLPVYAADDPSLEGLTAGGDGLQVLLLSVKRSLTLQVQVLPKTVRNKKVTLSVDNPEVIRVKGNAVTALKPGETVLTITSQEDPAATKQYRIVVIQPVTMIRLTASEKSVAVGSTLSLTPAYLPENATRKQVTWSSATPQIAAVDENGVVTGLKRGTARIVATAADGSKIRATISIRVTQGVQEITLDKPELTVDVGRNGMLKATVLPKNADNKKVIWSSSDESIAKVNAQGRITGVALGDCEITCTSQEANTVLAKATVHVQQPVKKITLGAAPSVYNGETAQLTWTVEPDNASNPKLAFSSSNQRVLTVDENGVITGVAGGEAFVNAISTDGSRRQARTKVKVYQHLTGVHMLRKTAYIDLGETSSAGAILEPQKAKNLNHNMSWESADPSVATVAPEKNKPTSVRITGAAYGDTYVTGTTEDGGFQTSIRVRIGNWEQSLRITDAKVNGADGHLTVRNDSDLNITSITVEVTVYDIDGNVVPSNSKDPNKPFKMVYSRTLGPGESTRDNYWKTINFMLPDSMTVSTYVFKITQFEIDHDWIKVIRRNHQPTRKAPVHI